MKYKNPFSQLVIIGIFLITVNSCKKEDHALLPEVTSYEIINDSEFSATGKGTVISDGGAFVTERGICWSTNQMPTINDKFTIEGTGIGDFTSKLTELVQGTTYYARAYATNRKGTVYGDTFSFVAGTITDVDGNLYNMVTIGTQIWMKENLKTTKYRNGEQIPNITYDKEWSTLNTGAYCWFDNDATTNKATYGALYNWYAVSDSRKIAPTGWHVASDEEWKTLEIFIGMTIEQANLVGWRGTDQGDKLKEAGASHWKNIISNATNSSGFTALPGNRRELNGVFSDLSPHVGGWWWTTMEDNSVNAWYHQLFSSYSKVGRDPADKKFGFSVRCVKD